MQSQGALAVKSGLAIEGVIRSLFSAHGFTKVSTDTVDGLRSWRRGLFTESGCYAQHVKAPLVAHYHKAGRVAVVDFGVVNSQSDTVLLSSKSQHSSGSAEEKLEFEIQQLIATELPAAMLVYGDGFRKCLLEEVWERARYYGGSRVYLFRTIEKLTKWIRDGLPVSGRGVRSSDIFIEYCDREP